MIFEISIHLFDICSFFLKCACDLFAIFQGSSCMEYGRETRGRQNAYNKEIEGRQEGDRRETRGRQNKRGGKRETEGRQGGD